MQGFSTLQIKCSTFDGLNFLIEEAFTYTCSTGEVITVLAGTTTDGASIPRELWGIAAPSGLYWPAAVVHDAAYHESATSDKAAFPIPKDHCDWIFLDAMTFLKVTPLESRFLYDGVHYCGWKSFKTDAKIAAARIAPEAKPVTPPVILK